MTKTPDVPGWQSEGKTPQQRARAHGVKYVPPKSDRERQLEARHAELFQRSDYYSNSDIQAQAADIARDLAFIRS